MKSTSKVSQWALSVNISAFQYVSFFNLNGERKPWSSRTCWSNRDTIFSHTDTNPGLPRTASFSQSRWKVDWDWLGAQLTCWQRAQMSCCSGLSDKLKGTVQLKIDGTSVLSRARWLKIGLNHSKSAQKEPLSSWGHVWLCVFVSCLIKRQYFRAAEHLALSRNSAYRVDTNKLVSQVKRKPKWPVTVNSQFHFVLTLFPPSVKRICLIHDLPQ